ncbi:MAG: DUF2029 domain-containing protein [Chloroflexi bacterium]|nr:MAG: DUF2029 domain-containing protein [Chloroflexota bacterium]
MLQQIKQSNNIILWFAAAVVVFFALGVAIFSAPTHDYELYLRSWEVTIQGQNPWSVVTTNAYGPIHSALALLYSIHFNLPRMLFVVLWLVCSFGISLLVHQNQAISQEWKYVFYLILFLNPLFWVFIVRFGTNDMLMAFFVLASIVLFIKQRDIPAGAFMALAIGLKFIPIIMVPFLIYSRKRIRWRFAFSVLISLIIIFGVGYFLWGSNMRLPFQWAAERHSKILSIYRFLRGEFSPLRIVVENPNLDGLSVYLSITAVSIFFLIHVMYRFDSFVSSIISLGLLLMFYKVGHHQFYITLILLIMLWIGLEYEHIASANATLTPFFIFTIWIAFVSFLYILTDGYEGTNFREILGLPTFGFIGWMLWRIIQCAWKQSIVRF